MKVSDMKRGQLLGVRFPYGIDPKAQYGYRVLREPYKANAPVHFNHDHGKKVFEDPYFVVVSDVKTGESKKFAFESLDEDVPNWELIEEAAPFTQGPAQA